MPIYFKNLPLISDPELWTTGSGGSSGYGQNGNTGENERVIGVDPWGNSAVVWETRASGDGGADGGWNTDSFGVDITKLYRFSVWVKRTSSSSGGTFYLGTAGGNECPNALGTSSQMCNPYWHCGGTGGLTQDQWYLVVGHIFPYTYTSTIGHPDTGFWTVSYNGKIISKVGSINQCNISGQDLKWGASSSSTYHRTYHYYCGDNTTRLQFFRPRVDICDGNQPTVEALLKNRIPTMNSLSVITEGGSAKSQKVVATGGVITQSGDWRIHRFNSTGTFTVTSYKGDSLNIEYLIVGGGGGGGMDMGGGGGGGGVLTGTSVVGSGSYTITVGAGGSGAPAGGTNGQPGSHQFTISATNGGNSSFNGLTAYGGGFGASSYYGYTPNYGTPGNGGCGGGPSGYSDGGTRSGGSGTSGQGYNGGGGGGQYYSGGGGGAGAVGVSSTNRPDGGSGKFSGILGRPFYWGGGGGGASYSLSTGGYGGIGGGGGGALGDTTAGGRQAIMWGIPGTNGSPNSWAQVPGGDGGTNTGGGGGGGSHYNSNNKGGNGGSGIVIIRYKYK